MKLKLPALFVVISMGALASACARAEAEIASAAPSAAEESAPVADISVSGCLERNPEGAFLITHISAVSRRASGPSGATAADRVATPAAFEIGPDGSKVLTSIVGQWVNVSGSLHSETRIDATVVSVLGESCGAPAPSAGGRI